MQRFSKRIAALQPELKKLQEKYADNPKKLQQEQMKMYREHNVNPVGCLGMAPMILQMPIWVALYAMLYFAIELRQQPAFYGLLQMFGNWNFLADLSQPDRFIDFGGPISFLRGVPLLGSIEGINLLPILMGAIFYLQQKYMTPQNPNLTPEQETQQKIMRVLFPVMFPIMLYNAPAGLTLYIMTSSCIGIIESRYIRAHVSALELDEPKEKKPSRWRRWLQAQQDRVESARTAMKARPGGNGRSGARSSGGKGRGGRRK
jgi:YidC/Oxa1 family membrane protein insertase